MIDLPALQPLPLRQFRVGSTTPVVCGAGVAAGLADRLGDLVATPRVVLITDPGLVRAGVLDRVRGPLIAAGVACRVFDAVEANPSTDNVDAAIEAARAADPATLVVALGGGSAMDVAKGVALGLVNPVGALGLDYRNDLEPALPLVAVPTTAGTGSETNGWGVLTDSGTGRKLYIGHVSAQPRLAVLDPALTVGLPAATTAATGIDALTHAIECLCSRNATPYADPIALGAAATIGTWLPRAVAQGDDLEARAQMLLAAHLAGVAMATGTGLGLAHAIGHALSSRLGTPHGVALAAVLPAVMTHVAPVRPDALARVAIALGAAQLGDPEWQSAERAIEAVLSLRGQVDCEPRLGELGVTDANRATIVADALGDVVLVNAPRIPDATELTSLLEGLA